MPHTLHLEDLIAPDQPAISIIPSYHTNGASHSHDFYELVYVTEGYCLHNVDGLSTLLMEGDIFIMRPGITHKYAGNRVTRIYNCVFGESALVPYIDELRTLPGLDTLFDDDFSSTGSGISRMHLTLNERNSFLKIITWMGKECSEHRLGWKLRLPSDLIQLLVEYARAFQLREDSGHSENVYPEYVHQALSVIDANYCDCDLSVHRIASLVGVSDDYLTRQFHRVTGISTQEYLRRYRFARAMDLLQTDCSIGDVAKQAGFRTLSYFSREFTRELGVTPSKYRNQTIDQ